MTFSPRNSWDLDELFPGGSSSAAFRSYLNQVKEAVADCREEADSLPGGELSGLAALAVRLNEVGLRLYEAEAFADALTLVDLTDEGARLLKGEVFGVRAEYSAIMNHLDQRLLDIPAERWAEFLSQIPAESVRFGLEVRRDQAEKLLPPAQENLIKRLATDGLHGWADVPRIIYSRMQIELESLPGSGKIPIREISTLLQNGDVRIRKEAYEKQMAEREREAPLLASALNHIAGYRIAAYRERGWTSVMQEALSSHLITRESVDAMWEAVARVRPRLAQALSRRAALLGQSEPCVWDLAAPIMADPIRLQFSEAAAAVVEHWGALDPEMGAFAREAFEKGWVDACNRPHQQPQLSKSFSFSHSKRRRVLMSKADDPILLAHELGHAHSYGGFFDAPLSAGFVARPFTLIETPSSFGQLVVAKGLIRSAATPRERLHWLNEQLSWTVQSLCLMFATYEFERCFYEERLRGPVSLERIKELDMAVRRQAYGMELQGQRPFAWAWPMTFETSASFYNFPYAVGYLLSGSLYARALEDRARWGERYSRILQDIGRMTVEQLAEHHLGVDLTRPEGWQDGLAVIMADVDEFLTATSDLA